MKLIAWLLLSILCLLLCFTGVGIIFAVPMWIFGTIGLAFLGLMGSMK